MKIRPLDKKLLVRLTNRCKLYTIYRPSTCKYILLPRHDVLWEWQTVLKENKDVLEIAKTIIYTRKTLLRFLENPKRLWKGMRRYYVILITYGACKYYKLLLKLYIWWLYMWTLYIMKLLEIIEDMQENQFTA